MLGAAANYYQIYGNARGVAEDCENCRSCPKLLSCCDEEEVKASRFTPEFLPDGQNHRRE